jgi:hypothetical protein
MTTARSSRPDEPRPPLARLAELAFIVPIEVSSRLIDAVPAVVDKLPSAAERVRREVVLARFLGKMVVDQGVRELRTRLQPDDRGSSPVTHQEHEERPGPASDDEPAVHPPVRDHADDDVPDVTSLALADYDHLSSAQIVAKLDGLDAVERDAIERYERNGRHRRTVLGKLDQLRTATE